MCECFGERDWVAGSGKQREGHNQSETTRVSSSWVLISAEQERVSERHGRLTLTSERLRTLQEACRSWLLGDFGLRRLLSTKTSLTCFSHKLKSDDVTVFLTATIWDARVVHGFKVSSAEFAWLPPQSTQNIYGNQVAVPQASPQL